MLPAEVCVGKAFCGESFSFNHVLIRYAHAQLTSKRTFASAWTTLTTMSTSQHHDFDILERVDSLRLSHLAMLLKRAVLKPSYLFSSSISFNRVTSCETAN
jgi:hypothetical protein